MATCNKCGKKLKYNQYKRYRKQILCYECYDNRLEDKAEKKKKAMETAMEEVVAMDSPIGESI